MLYCAQMQAADDIAGMGSGFGFLGERSIWPCRRREVLGPGLGVLPVPAHPNRETSWAPGFGFWEVGGSQSEVRGIWPLQYNPTAGRASMRTASGTASSGLITIGWHGWGIHSLNELCRCYLVHRDAGFRGLGSKL